MVRFFSIFLLAMLSLSSVVFARAVEQQLPPPVLRLQRGSFDVQQGFAARGDAVYTSVAGYTIIQFAGPISAAQRADLEQTGVAILEYLPDYAYLVRGTETQFQAATALKGVYGRTDFTLADKLAPSVLAQWQNGTRSFAELRVHGWPDQPNVAASLARQQIDLTQPLSRQTLQQLAALPEVRWIEPATKMYLQNAVARSITHVDPVWQQRQLFGNGQVVAVTDSGLDTGSLTSIHADFAGRIVGTRSLSEGGHWDDQLGHGTHVAGTVAGSGAASGAQPAAQDYANSYAGVAPEAGLVIQAFESLPSGELVGITDSIAPLLASAYTMGATIHNASWGGPTGAETDLIPSYGGYPAYSQEADRFMWDNPDSLLVFAAGNSGQDGATNEIGFCDGDGVVDPDSIVTPGTAKNVLTVGASESLVTTGGLSGAPWFLINLCFTTDPIMLDTVSDNINGMAAFSSRGPTDDGRIKPDLVAPGTNIVSAHSLHPDSIDLWAPHETNPNYTYSGGTSMATPHVSGLAALVREWLGRTGSPDPSAALLKAILMNTTFAGMAPGQYGTGPTQEIPYTTPNTVNGWGRADLEWLVRPAPFGLWFDDHTSGLATGQQVNYSHAPTQQLEVLTSTQPLRVMLTWTDPPASLSAAQQLVNDLDLVVTGPDGQVYYGNAMNHDRTNNTEGVLIANPQPGFYTMSVRGHNVPMATQPYALAVAGPIDADGIEGGATPTPGTPTATPDTPTITPTTITPTATGTTPTSTVATPTPGDSTPTSTVATPTPGDGTPTPTITTPTPTEPTGTPGTPLPTSTTPTATPTEQDHVIYLPVVLR